MSGVMPNEYNNGIDSITDAIEQMNVDNANDVPQPDDMSLPSALIVTNVDEQVFQNDTIKVCNNVFCFFDLHTFNNTNK